MVPAFAKVMDMYEPRLERSGWEREFQPVTEQGERMYLSPLFLDKISNFNRFVVDPLSLALIIASDALALIPTSKIKVLPLPVRSSLYPAADKY